MRLTNTMRREIAKSIMLDSVIASKITDFEIKLGYLEQVLINNYCKLRDNQNLEVVCNSINADLEAMNTVLASKNTLTQAIISIPSPVKTVKCTRRFYINGNVYPTISEIEYIPELASSSRLYLENSPAAGNYIKERSKLDSLYKEAEHAELAIYTKLLEYSTSDKLIEAWPAVAAKVEYQVEKAKSEASTALTVPIEDLNNMLGWSN